MKRFQLLVVLFSFSVHVHAQQDRFSQPAHFHDLHTIYTYQKSNWDGSHASSIFLYIGDSGRLQSFKWSRGDEAASLVTADFDWQRFTVKRFQNHRVKRDGSRQLVAELWAGAPRKIVFQIGGHRDSMTLAADLWHSYDFDFAGLGFAWRALKNKKTSFTFWVADPAMADGKPTFINKGEVTVVFLKEDSLQGKTVFRYSINGPGLEHKGGDIWIDPLSWMIEKYQIALPDEEGFVNGQLLLQKTEKLSPEAWQKFILARLQEK